MYPVKNYKITCKYGVKGGWKCGYHCGVDLIPTDKDYNIYAPVKATVFTVKMNHSSYGNYVVLKHTDGYFSRYAHLDSITVKKGQAVSEGDILGVMGNTGNSSGRHLHFEVHKGLTMKYPANTNPVTYLENGIYSLVDGIHTIKIPISKFKIEVWDKFKKTSKIKNYANGGFFADGYRENKKDFVLPVGHLIADCTYITELNYKYLQERGRIKGNKIYVDASKCPNGAVSPENKAFGGKFISTLIVRNGRADILKIKTIKDFMDADYAVSGVPVIKNGKDVSWKNDVLPEGWESGNCRKTGHNFIGLKNDGYIYLMGITSKKDNCIQSSEVYNLLKGQGFTDLIKLDGGGSTVIDFEGKNVFATSGNRQIHNVIMWG